MIDAKIEKAKADERARIIKILKQHQSHRRGGPGEIALIVAISHIERSK